MGAVGRSAAASPPPPPPPRRPATAAAAAAAATARRNRADRAALVRGSGRAAAAPNETCSRAARNGSSMGAPQVERSSGGAVVGGATDARLGSRGAGLRMAAACDDDA